MKKTMKNRILKKKDEIGWIVDKNSDKKDRCMVLIMLNSRSGMWG